MVVGGVVGLICYVDNNTGILICCDTIIHLYLSISPDFFFFWGGGIPSDIGREEGVHLGQIAS